MLETVWLRTGSNPAHCKWIFKVLFPAGIFASAELGSQMATHLGQSEGERKPSMSLSIIWGEKLTQLFLFWLF